VWVTDVALQTLLMVKTAVTSVLQTITMMISITSTATWSWSYKYFDDSKFLMVICR